MPSITQIRWRPYPNLPKGWQLEAADPDSDSGVRLLALVWYDQDTAVAFPWRTRIDGLSDHDCTILSTAKKQAAKRACAAHGITHYELVEAPAEPQEPKWVTLGFAIPAGMDTPSETLAAMKQLLLTALQGYRGDHIGTPYWSPEDEELATALLTES